MSAQLFPSSSALVFRLFHFLLFFPSLPFAGPSMRETPPRPHEVEAYCALKPTCEADAFADSLAGCHDGVSTARG
jgi:hypothetical protein